MRGGTVRSLGWACTHTAAFKMGNQQGRAHGTLLNAVSAWMGGRLGKNGHMYTWLSPFLFTRKLSQCCLLTGSTKEKVKKNYCLTQFLLDPTINHRQLCYVLSSSKSSAKHA